MNALESTLVLSILDLHPVKHTSDINLKNSRRFRGSGSNAVRGI